MPTRRGSGNFGLPFYLWPFAVPITRHPSVSVVGNSSYASTISDSKPVVKIGFRDAHSFVGHLHIPAQINSRPPGGCRYKIDRQLAFAVVRINAAWASPKPAEQHV